MVNETRQEITLPHVIKREQDRLQIDDGESGAYRKHGGTHWMVEFTISVRSIPFFSSLSLISLSLLLQPSICLLLPCDLRISLSSWVYGCLTLFLHSQLS